MSLWTNRHIIPFSNAFDTTVKSTVFEENIWMAFDVNNFQNEEFVEHLLTQVLVFDPDLKTFTQINHVYPADWPRELHSLVANEENIYMWRVTNHEYRNLDYHLFKLDRVTLEWERMMSVRRASEWISVVIINEIMYILEQSDQINFLLIEIDLTQRKVVDRVEMPITWNSFLTAHNGNLYLVEDKNDDITVIEWKNGMYEDVAQEYHDFDKYTKVESVQCADPNECFSIMKYLTFQDFEIRTFDFESRKWEFNVVQPGLLYHTFGKHLCVLKINGLIYSLVWTVKKRQEKQYELAVLDLHPSLTSICLDELTTRYCKETNAKKLDDVKQRLPIQLRAKFEDLLKWETGAK